MQSNQLKIISIVCILTGSVLLGLGNIANKSQTSIQNPSTQPIQMVNSIGLNQIQNSLLDSDQTYQQKINTGLSYFINQDFRLAISEFVQANKTDKTQALPFILSAESYLNLDKPELAKKNIYAAKFKQNYGLYGQLIELQYHIYSRNNFEAENILRALDPQFAETQFWNAIYALNIQEIDIAKSYFENLIAHPDNNPFYHIALSFKYNYELYKTFRDVNIGFLQTLTAKNLLNHNQIIASRLLSYTALKQNPVFRDAWLTLGYSFVKSREYNKALQTLDKTRKLDPYYPETHLYLGIAYYNINNYANAIRHLNLANNQESKNKHLIQEFLGLSLFKTQNPKATMIFENLVAQNYFSPNIFSSLSQIYLSEKNLEKAAQILQLFKQNYFDHELYSHNLGHLYFLTKNYEKSLEFLQKAILKNPNASSSMYLISQNYKALHNQQLYTQTLNQALQIATKQKDQNLYNLILEEIKNG